MATQPHILLIDNNPLSQKILERTFINLGKVHVVKSETIATEIIASYPIDAILLNADSLGQHSATSCAWLKSEPRSSQIPLLIIAGDVNADKELKYYQSGADDVIRTPCPTPLLQHKVLKHTRSQLGDNTLYQASCILNRFYENTYTNTSLSHCMTECLSALQDMGLKAALHVCDHPELTCSSFGPVNDYEKALMSYAECIKPSADSARFTHGDDTMAILIQNLPNQHHPLYKSLLGWVKKIFSALSQKAKNLLSKPRQAAQNRQPLKDANEDVPHTTNGAQRLHYFVERALHAMEVSCEAEMNRSIHRVDEVISWALPQRQKQHILSLKDNLLELKESLLVNCMEIESRYLQFVTERRAKTRLNLGW